MWCKKCNIETDESICPICQSKTIEEVPVEIYWCDNCKTPIILPSNSIDKNTCSICGSSIRYLSSDLRPVFPEERLLLSELLNKIPEELMNSSIWAYKHKYYIDGKTFSIPSKLLEEVDVDSISSFIKKNQNEINYNSFNQDIERFTKANKNRLEFLQNEAISFIQQTAQNYEEENIVISFSGGKDSTVTADIVVKALSDPSLVHIFGDTTLEFPTTIEYVNRYRESHPLAIFQIAKNNEQDFYTVCADIGPPARLMRWCCSMFKTGPISRIINSLYGNQQILTFYGIRKFESVSRGKYNRIENSAESIKIQQQTVASPIFSWKNIDVWTYILSEEIDFNDAYRLGYDRVGCWCCPNNSKRSQFLSKIYLPEESNEWRKFLIDFAKNIGKPDPIEYVDSGNWKARQGGNGLASAGTVKIKFTNCTTEDHAKIYQLVKPYSDEFIGMFVPFGKIAPELGLKLLNETVILDERMNIPILSIQPFNQNGYEYAVKVKTMNVADHDELQRMVSYQIRKYNACRKCLKCESICRQGAISIIGDNYYISPEKCIQCKMCVTPKYLRGGCLMEKYLRTK